LRISTFSNAHNPFSRWLSSLATVSANALLQAISLLLLAPSLGAGEYAVIVVATAVATVAAEFVGFGAGDLLVREVSRDPTVHRPAFGRALWLAGATFLPVALVATSLAWLSFDIKVPAIVLFTLIGSEIVALRAAALAEQIAVAHHATYTANATRIYSALIRFSTVCIAIYVAKVATVSAWSMFAAGSAVIMSIGCMAISVRRFGRPTFGRSARSLREVGVLFSLMQIIRAIQFSLDKFAVASVASPAIVGAYGVASRIAQLGISPTAAVTRITYPIFFEKGGKGVDETVRYAVRVSPAVVGVGLLSTVALAGIAFALPSFLGAAFAPAKAHLLMLALLPLAAALQNLAGSILTGADFQAHRIVASIAGTALTAIAAFAGARFGGVPGAIAGYMLGQFLIAAATMLAVVNIRRRRTP